MARKGFYKVSAEEPGWEICKSNISRPCWGANVPIDDRDILNTRAGGCSGTISPGEIYLRHPDPRIITQHRTATPYDWAVCMVCATHFHGSKLSGDLTPWKPITPGDLKAARSGVERILKELNNMGVPGGVWSV